jgi:acyl-CoA dehydrogenase
MSDIENILIDTTIKIMKDRSTKELINEAEEGVYPEKLWKELQEMGMTTVAVPEEAGGTGFSYKEALNILKIAGEYSAPVPLAEMYIGNWFLHGVGLEIVDSSLTVAPVKYSKDVLFREEQGNIVVKGEVRHVPFARFVEQVLVTGKNNTTGELMVAVIPVQDATVTEGTSLAGESRDVLTFSDVLVDGGNSKVISQEDASHLYNLYTLSRIVLMAGALERTMDLSIQYVNEREQFGRPIGKFQAIKQQLAVLAGEVTSATLAADYAIEALNKGLDLTNEVAIAKIRLGEATDVAASIAHQVHAAIGYTHEHPLHHNTRRLWSWRDEGGTEQLWAKYLGKYILSDSTESLWHFVTSESKKEEVNTN